VVLGLGFLAIAHWPQPPIPNPQSPIPNPQSPSFILIFLIYDLKLKINSFLFIIYNIILSNKNLF
jgi:hypothetical protein